MIRLVAFDLDGTLSPGLTVVGRLAQGIGKLPDMNALEARLARGEITRDVLAEAAAGHLRGMSVAGAAALLDPWALMPGAEETVVRLRTQGIAVLLVTLTWRFAAGLIGRRLALDGWSGSEPELDGDGLCTGKIRHLFTEPDKRHFIEAHAADLGIAMSQVVAVEICRRHPDVPGGRPVDRDQCEPGGAAGCDLYARCDRHARYPAAARLCLGNSPALLVRQRHNR